MRKITLAFAALMFLGAGYVVGQVTTEKKPEQLVVFKSAQPVRINDELALRIEGAHDGRVFGTLVTKIDGRWVEVQLASTNVRATTPGR
jgi:hypothetical protein